MISLLKSEEEITKVSLSKLSNADDNMKKHVVNLSKTLVNLSKSSGVDLGNHVARVCLVLDYSGSMRDEYTGGKVQEIINRMIPFGLHFDDNGEIETFIFHDEFAETATITDENYGKYVKNCLLGKYSFGGTVYWPVLKAVGHKYFNMPFKNIEQYDLNASKLSYSDYKAPQKKPGFFAKLFGKAVIEEIQDDKNVEEKQAEAEEFDMNTPVFVIFITDGDQYSDERARTNDVIRELAKYNVFVQFIGCGNNNFKYLEELDDIDNRECDNTGFVKFNDIADISDEELYNKVLEQYPDWLKAKGIK